MVMPETVIAFVAHLFKETVQIMGNIGLIVDVAVGIAVSLAAYHVESG